MNHKNTFIPAKASIEATHLFGRDYKTLMLIRHILIILITADKKKPTNNHIYRKVKIHVYKFRSLECENYFPKNYILYYI